MSYIPIGHHTDHGPIDLGLYDSLGEYCGPSTASSVFLIIIIIVYLHSKIQRCKLCHLRRLKVGTGFHRSLTPEPV